MAKAGFVRLIQVRVRGKHFRHPTDQVRNLAKPTESEKGSRGGAFPILWHPEGGATSLAPTYCARRAPRSRACRAGTAPSTILKSVCSRESMKEGHSHECFRAPSQAHRNEQGSTGWRRDCAFGERRSL